MRRTTLRLVVMVVGVLGLGSAAVPAYADSSARYIVQLTDPPLASYRGGIGGLEATNPAARGEVKLDPASAASRAYLAHLAGRHDAFVAAMQQATGRTASIAFRYRYAFNGLAVTLSEQEAAAVARISGVRRVERESVLKTTTDAGPAWIGAPAIWGGVGSAGTKGEGIVAGIIDTGVNHTHPSFAKVGGDGYVHSNPRGRYLGACDPLTGLPFCNDKLIGAYDFTNTSPVDDNSHGSHTASTVAGNVLTATIHAPTLSMARPISGVAPHANLITYKACSTVTGTIGPPLTGECPGAAMIGAIDQATADRVDVINFSIGGGSRSPWTDSLALGFLGAYDAGVFVAASAGNSGPKAGTHGAPSNAPWVTSVGASTHNRAFFNSLVGMTGGSTTAPADMRGKSFTSGYGPAQIVYAGSFGDGQCLAPFAPGTFNGAIVICDRGINPRVEKGRNVKVGGAGGMVLVNTAADGESTIADGHELPAVHLGFSAGHVLKAWVGDGGSGHTARISGTEANTDAANGDVMAGFSSRGPDKSVPDVLKPDIAAPGVDVLAAVYAGGASTTNPTAPPYGVFSGTSMASPHVAGSAALLRALHRDWTPADVRSALMTTSLTGAMRKEDGVKPADAFDTGAGRVDLTKAGQAGLAFRETSANFLAADPGAGGNPTTLNLPSLAHGDCDGRCSWTRVVTSTLGSTVGWSIDTSGSRGLRLSVSPSRFDLAPGASQTITVTADVTRLPLGNWAFGQLTITSRQAGVSAAHVPLAVLPAGAPQAVDISTTSPSGSHAVSVTSQVAISRLSSRVSGLVTAESTTRRLPQDLTNTDPYDSEGGGTFVKLLTVPAAGSKFVSAEIKSTTSSDVDLYVGRDSDGDGQADSNEEVVCQSASEIALESCRFGNTLEPGTYWVLVQNWAFGQLPEDDIELATLVLPATDSGNLTVSGPASVPAGTPFDVTLTWNVPTMRVGDTWVGYVELGSRQNQVGDVETLLVTIKRTG